MKIVMIPVLLAALVASFVVPYPMNVVQAFVVGVSLGTKIMMIVTDRNDRKAQEKAAALG